MNKVMLIGNVGKEPVMHYYDRDQAVAMLTLATTERGYTLPNGTQVPDRTEWHNIVLYKGLAKIAERYIHKGDKLFVEGKIRNRSYDDMLSPKQPVGSLDEKQYKQVNPEDNKSKGDTGASDDAPF